MRLSKWQISDFKINTVNWGRKSRLWDCSPKHLSRARVPELTPNLLIKITSTHLSLFATGSFNLSLLVPNCSPWQQLGHRSWLPISSPHYSSHWDTPSPASRAASLLLSSNSPTHHQDMSISQVNHRTMFLWFQQGGKIRRWKIRSPLEALLPPPKISA